MKKSYFKLLALLLVFCLTIPFASCMDLTQETEVEGYSYVTIDVNPSVELIVDGNTVVEAYGANDDALVLLSGEEIEGMSVEEATKKIVSLCEELGYLTEENQNVKLTVTADTDELVSIIEEFAEKGAKLGSEKAIVNKDPRSYDERIVKKLKEEDPEIYEKLTPAKLRLIESIMEHDPEMTYEIGVEMSIEELSKMLKETLNTEAAQIGEELRKEMEERFGELKKEAKRRVAEMYGDEYLEKWNTKEDIKDIFKKFEDKALNIELSEEDTQEIMSILGIESIEEIALDGKLNVQALEKYIDTELVGEEFVEIKDQLKAIIEKYDHDKYEFSEEELEEIKGVIGENVDVSKLEELKDIVKQHEKEVDEFKEDLDISEIKQGLIDVFESEFEELEEQVEKEFQEQIDDAKKEFDRIKEEKKNQR
ncbi:MAG: hypothetical protein IJ400_02235 [Clostridia bacterium]|nr:hypothetical protein [Clostridia bacterium]